MYISQEFLVQCTGSLIKTVLKVIESLIEKLKLFWNSESKMIKLILSTGGAIFLFNNAILHLKLLPAGHSKQISLVLTNIANFFLFLKKITKLLLGNEGYIRQE